MRTPTSLIKARGYTLHDKIKKEINVLFLQLMFVVNKGNLGCICPINTDTFIYLQNKKTRIHCPMTSSL